MDTRATEYSFTKTWKWVVMEENPKPDEYIAVIAVDEDRLPQLEQRPCSMYENSEQALVRARLLREYFNVRSIRIFYLEGNSAILKQ
jgi:hypothetical protein